MLGIVFLLEVADFCRSGDKFAAFGPPGFNMLGEGRGLMTSDLGTFLAEVTVLVGGSPEREWAGGSEYGE